MPRGGLCFSEGKGRRAGCSVLQIGADLAAGRAKNLRVPYHDFPHRGAVIEVYGRRRKTHRSGAAESFLNDALALIVAVGFARFGIDVYPSIVSYKRKVDFHLRLFLDRADVCLNDGGI